MRKILYLPLFPYTNPKKNKFKNKAMLGVGGNIGDCLHRFELLFRKIALDSRFMVLSTSPIYRNPAFGYVNQEDFYNATIQISTRCGVFDMFNMIFYWERYFGRGRKREFKNAPRTLDVDLLWFNYIQCNLPNLSLPHPYWDKRESVLVPLRFQKII